MQLPIPPYKREKIIRLCLKGNPYRNVSKIESIATGSVSNIFNDFLERVEIDPNYLRYLIKEIKENTNLDLPQFAISYRISNMLTLMGIADDESKRNLESFLNTIYKISKARNYPADLVTEYAWHLFEVAKNQNMPIEQIPEYIQGNIIQKTKLQEEINQLNSQQQDAQNRAATALKDAQTTEQDISRHKNAEKELEKYGLSINDPDKLAAALNNAKQYDYETNRIVAEISEKESLQQKIIKSQSQFQSWEDKIKQQEVAHNKIVEEHERTIHQLNEHISELKKQESALTDKVTVLDEQLLRSYTAKISKDMDYAAIGFISSSAIESTVQSLQSLLETIYPAICAKQFVNHDSNDYSLKEEIGGIENAKINLSTFFAYWYTKDALDIELANSAAKQLRDNLDLVSQKLDYYMKESNTTDKKSRTIQTMDLVSQTRDTISNLEDMLSHDRTDYASSAAA